MKNIIKFIFYSFFYYFFRIFPIKKNKIFFQNFNGKGYGDNPKYIAQEILRRNLDFELVWAAIPEYYKNIPEMIKIVPYRSIRAVYEEATSGIWIDNCRKQLYVKKRKKQYYIQTWHGTVNLKRIEKDVEFNLSGYYIKQAKHDSFLADLFISECNFTSKLYKSSFWYNGEILECGSPKEDLLINNINLKNKVLDYYNIKNNYKIILYAPTFRDNFSIDVYDINYEQILNYLQEETKTPWIFLVRLHPNITKKSDSIKYTENIINACHYDDMQELMLASDILISDYSDCMFEFALMKKPVFLYIKDYNEYKVERDFYFDLYSLPFPNAANNDELLLKMKEFNNTLYLNSLDVFYNKTGFIKDGRASEKVVDKIVNVIYQ